MNGEVFNQSLCIMSRVAYQYYIEGKSRADISKSTGLSASTISRLLKRAKEDGIIEIKMGEPFLSCNRMETQLVNQYGLRRVIVVPVEAETDRNINVIKNQVALEGARYLQRIIKDGDILGMAWGGTMYNLIQYLNPCRKVDANIITMHGSIANCDSKLAVNALVKRAAMAFGGKHATISYPGLLKSPGDITAMREKNYKDMFSLFHKITISVCGVGAAYPSQESLLFKTNYLNQTELRELREKDACCDLVLRFIDKQGRECDTSLRDRTMSIDLETYKKIPCKIISASGSFKAKAVSSLLQGGLVNVLIIDSNMAGKLIDGE